MNLVFVLCHIALECLHFLFQQAVDTQIRGVRREVINVRSKGSQKKSWWFRRNEETLCFWLKMRKDKPLVVLSHLCRRIVYTFGWDFHISAYVLLFLSHMYWGSFILEIWQRGPRSNQQTCLTWMFGQWGKKRSRKGCVCVCGGGGGGGGVRGSQSDKWKAHFETAVTEVLGWDCLHSSCTMTFFFKP